ncbi:hypothetical protein VP01_148g14 [Puccinia sorghi]|uniref:Uncharacterized protein n=1 Tax=Puccinia sorghi TaxID=27349 RepID=A0A0L6VK02_9BASI|nr:hypothetical protein VP01_148g14 [Puccinia sorghi]
MGDPFLQNFPLVEMTAYYTCPHLPTCCDVKYTRKHCNDHSHLSIHQIQHHCLNTRIHPNCQAPCPAYNLNGRSLILTGSTNVTDTLLQINR